MFRWKNKSIWICFMRCGINLPYSLPRPGQGYWKVHWLALWMPNDTERIGKLNIYAMFLYAPQLQLPYEFWNAKLLPATGMQILYNSLQDEFILFPRSKRSRDILRKLCFKILTVCSIKFDKFFELWVYLYFNFIMV